MSQVLWHVESALVKDGEIQMKLSRPTQQSLQWLRADFGDGSYIEIDQEVVPYPCPACLRYRRQVINMVRAMVDVQHGGGFYARERCTCPDCHGEIEWYHQNADLDSCTCGQVPHLSECHMAPLPEVE